MNRPVGHRALRKGRVSLPRHIYLVTAVTAYRRPLFKDTDMARAFSQSMLDPRCWGDASPLCWVLMPDQWHGLIELGPSDSLSLVINRVKAVTAKRLGCVQPSLVWGRGYHDRALRKEEDLRTVARYLVANPLRAGLVDHVLDYPYWNCIWL
jgi:putative transposase